MDPNIVSNSKLPTMLRAAMFGSALLVACVPLAMAKQQQRTYPTSPSSSVVEAKKGINFLSTVSITPNPFTWNGHLVSVEESWVEQDRNPINVSMPVLAMRLKIDGKHEKVDDEQIDFLYLAGENVRDAVDDPQRHGWNRVSRLLKERIIHYVDMPVDFANSFNLVPALNQNQTGNFTVKRSRMKLRVDLDDPIEH